MARIICISKYLLLEGGIAAKTYWLCKGLAERGHIVHVITDRKNIAPEYCIPTESNQSTPENIRIHRPANEIPWHIPNDPHRTLELLDVTIKVINEFGADVIDTGYLVPYGLIGYLASRITGVPFLLRHGGSDLEKFLQKDIWKSLMTGAFASAKTVITDGSHQSVISQFASRTLVLPPYVPDPSFFKPDSLPEPEKPVLALIGKANFYWRHKGWHRVVEIMRCLGTRVKYKIVSQGLGLEDFKNYVEDKVQADIEWGYFVHPFDMPAVLRSVNGIFIFEGDLPFPVFSNLVPESLYSGITVITDQPDMFKNYDREGVHLRYLSERILCVPENSPEAAANMILNYFERQFLAGEKMFVDGQDHRAYLSDNENAILSVCASITNHS